MCGQQANPPAGRLCFETKPIKRVWIRRAFNWITVVDLDLSELGVCVAVNMSAEHDITLSSAWAASLESGVLD